MSCWHVLNPSTNDRHEQQRAFDDQRSGLRRVSDLQNVTSSLKSVCFMEKSLHLRSGLI